MDSTVASSQTAMEVSFHGTEYTVSLFINPAVPSTLTVEVEKHLDAATWRGCFTASHLEDLTRKAGSFKKFPVFAKMLSAALRRESSSAFVDLLTPADLEALRSKTSARGGAALPHNKRYLILTYAGEFDRVHYPLPLAPEDCPDPERLRAIIVRLRHQLTATQHASGSTAVQSPLPSRETSSAAECTELQRENAALRDRLTRVERLATPADARQMDRVASEASSAIRELRQVQSECDELRRRCQAAEGEAERQCALLRREVRQKAQEASTAQQQANAAEMKALELKVKCQELEKECKRLRRCSVPYMRSRSATRPWVEPERPAQHHGCSSHQPVSHSLGASPRRQRGEAAYLSGRGAGHTSTSTFGRSSSSGRPPRFNPTDFVQQRREREQAAAARRSRMTSPARTPGGSMPTSGTSSPCKRQLSRAGSLERLRAATVASRMRASNNSEREARDISPSHSRRSTRPQTSRHGDTGTASSSPRMRQTEMQFPPLEARASSPSQALRDVKAWLNHFLDRQSGSQIRGVSDPAAKPSSRERRSDSLRSSLTIPPTRHSLSRPESPQWSQRYNRELERSGASDARRKSRDLEVGNVRLQGSNMPGKENNTLHDKTNSGAAADASADIADIDARLQSLQEFLRAAKASSSAALVKS